METRGAATGGTIDGQGVDAGDKRRLRQAGAEAKLTLDSYEKMSTSIYGSVEIKKFNLGFDDWFEIIDVGIALTGNYDLFGCLFGVRNYANFNPLFQDRDFPPDCSDEVSKKFHSEEMYRHLTWCSFHELKNVNLDEIADKPDSRIFDEAQTPKGKIVIKRFLEGPEETHKARHMSRRQALDDPDYIQLLELMEVLAKSYGDEGVRMVVWFD